MPSIQSISQRAYEIYLLRKESDIWEYGAKGTEHGDWVQAVQEIGEPDGEGGEVPIQQGNQS